MLFQDDVINLRPYVYALIRRWWLILLLAVVLSVAALAISLFQSRTYSSTATVLITRMRASLSLADQFPTVSDPTDLNSRLNAMLSITQSDSVAQTVLQSLKDSQHSSYSNINQLKSRVTVTSNGDLILVTASADTPSLAAEIANAWAREAVQTINRAYSGEQPLTEIQQQAQVVQKQYEAAQAALEAAIQSDQSDLLKKQIAESEKLFSDLADNRTWLIDYYDRRQQDMQMLITQAGALKLQIESGSHSTAGNLGDALAVLFARASMLGVVQQTATDQQTVTNQIPVTNQQTVSQKTVGIGSGLSITLQLSDPNMFKDNASNYAADLSVLIKQAEEEKTACETALETLTQAVNKGEGQDQIAAVAVNTQALKARLESENSRLRKLTSDRDLAWKAYQAMLEKETEIQNAPQNNEVVLAVPAIEAQTPAPRGTLRNIVMAGVVGLILGVFGLIFMEWWQSSEPSHSRGVSPASHA